MRFVQEVAIFVPKLLKKVEKSLNLAAKLSTLFRYTDCVCNNHAALQRTCQYIMTDSQY